MFFSSKMISELEILGYPVDKASKKSIQIFSKIYQKNGDNPKEAATKFLCSTFSKAIEKGEPLQRENLKNAQIQVDRWVRGRKIRPHFSAIFKRL